MWGFLHSKNSKFICVKTLITLSVKFAAKKSRYADYQVSGWKKKSIATHILVTPLLVTRLRRLLTTTFCFVCISTLVFLLSN